MKENQTFFKANSLSKITICSNIGKKKINNKQNIKQNKRKFQFSNIFQLTLAKFDQKNYLV